MRRYRRPLPSILLALLAVAGAGAGGCTSTQLFGIPPDPGPEFGVSGLQGPIPEPYASFNRVGPEAAALHADQICTLGYRFGGEKAMPTDPGTIIARRVSCRDYIPWIADMAPWLVGRSE